MPNRLSRWLNILSTYQCVQLVQNCGKAAHRAWQYCAQYYHLHTVSLLTTTRVVHKQSFYRRLYNQLSNSFPMLIFMRFTDITAYLYPQYTPPTITTTKYINI